MPDSDVALKTDESRSVAGQPATVPQAAPGASSNGATDASATTAAAIRGAIDKAVSDALAKAGRTAKGLADEEKRLKKERSDIEAQRAAWEQERERTEEEEVKDDPSAFRALRQRRTQDQLRARLASLENALAQREQTLMEREAAIGGAERRAQASLIASEKGVDAELLLELLPEGSPEAFRRLADSLSTASAATNPQQRTAVPHVDSGSSVGGVAVTDDNIDLLHRQGKISTDRYRQFLKSRDIT